MRYKVAIVRTLEAFLALNVGAHARLVADVETFGTDPRDGKLLGVALAPLEGRFADGSDAAYIVVQEYLYKTSTWQASQEGYLKLLMPLGDALQTASLIGFNYTYDQSWLDRYFGTTTWHSDAQLMWHMSEPADKTRGYKLKVAQTEVLGWPERGDRELEEQVKARGGSLKKGDHYLADTDVLGYYAGLDVISTAQLYAARKPFFDQHNAWPMLDRMMRYSALLKENTTTGVRVDVPRLERTVASLQETMKAARIAFVREAFPYVRKVVHKMRDHQAARYVAETPRQEFLANPKLWKKFNLSSDPQKRELFYGAMQLPVVQRVKPRKDPKTGRRVYPKTPAATVEAFTAAVGAAGRTDLSGAVREYARSEAAEAVLNGFAKPLLSTVRNGRVHPGFNACGTKSYRLSGFKPSFMNLPFDDEALMSCFSVDEGWTGVHADLCLHPKTELLTKRGWVPVLQVTLNDEVWQVAPRANHSGSWTKPLRTVRRSYSGTMCQYGNVRGRLDVTEGHRMLFVGQKHKTRKDKEKRVWTELASPSLTGKGKHLLLASNNGEDAISPFSVQELWTACALQADGRINTSATKTLSYSIEVSRPRKREKLRELLNRPGIVGKRVRPCHTMVTETWHGIHFRSPLLTGKRLNVELIGPDMIPHFLEALAFWDGHVVKHKASESVTWGCTDLEQVEVVQALLVRNGYEARLSTQQPPGNSRLMHLLNIRRNPRVRLGSDDVCSYYYTGEVGCVTVPAGYILVRSGGQTFVTGNCAIEPTVSAHYSQDPALLKVFREGKGDIYLDLALTLFPGDRELRAGYDPNAPVTAEIKERFKRVRKVAKIVQLAVQYTGTEYTVSLSLTQAGFPTTLEQAKVLVDNYWLHFARVAQCNRGLQRLHERKGFLVNAAGRVIRKSRHDDKDLPNLFFQSSAHDILELWVLRIYELAAERNVPIRPVLLDCHDSTSNQSTDPAALERVYVDALADVNAQVRLSVPIRAEVKRFSTFAGLKGDDVRVEFEEAA